jgi:hypothetical protein
MKVLAAEIETDECLKLGFRRFQRMVEGFTRKKLVGLSGIDRNVTEILGRNLTIYNQQCGGVGHWVSSDITFWRPCCPHGIAVATSTPPAQPGGFGAT